MNRLTVAAASALEALITAALLFGVGLVASTLMWAISYDLTVPWTVFVHAAADFWLLGHGATLAVSVPADATGVFGPVAGEGFSLSVAALALALIAALLAGRSGVRAFERERPWWGLAGALVSYEIIALLVGMLAQSSAVSVPFAQVLTLPVGVVALGFVAGVGTAFARAGGRLTDLPGLDRVRPDVRRVGAASLRGGVIASLGILAGGAIVFAAGLVLGYDRVVSLYEGLQGGIFGGSVLTLVQAAFVPNAVVFAASCLIGPGFSVGTGSTVSALGAQVGPLPAVPLLGALPQGETTWGFLGLAVPVAGGVIAALAVGRARASPLHRAIGAAGIGVAAGLVLLLLSWLAGGALGPGRLGDVGPAPWLIGGLCALEVALGAAVGHAIALVRSGGLAELRSPAGSD